GRIVEANLAAATLLGVERGQMTGQRFSSLVPRQERKPLRDHLDRCFATGLRGVMELTATSRGGEPVIVQLVGMPVLDPGGSTIACRATLTDISALKRSERMLGLLARASAVLAGSLRDVAAVAEIADLLAPAFADVCLVDVLGPRGSVRRIG